MGKTTAELEAQTGRFRAVGFEDPEHKQDDRGYFYAVVDTRDGSHIGWDGGEPEDQGLTRDWYWVVEALNQVDSEKDKFMAGLVGLRDDCLATYLGGKPRGERDRNLPPRHGVDDIAHRLHAQGDHVSIEALTLKCLTCGRTQKYARSIDPKIPARVATIELRCEKCNDGDFDAEVWRDKRGHLVNQAVAWPSAQETP